MRAIDGVRYLLLAAATLATAWSAKIPPAQAADRFDTNGQCVGDANGDGQVTIDEIITAVNNSLGGCQFQPVTLQFRANVGAEPFTCGSLYHNIGTTSAATRSR